MEDNVPNQSSRQVSRYAKHNIARHLTRSMGATALLGLSLIAGGVASGSAQAASSHSGPVDVLFAGSLLDLMQQKIEPAFQHATGYNVVGISAGSSALASEIKGGTQVGDVFLSASTKVDRSLEGAANGNWISSYQEFGRSPLVLGYNPASKFVFDLRHEPWFDVVTKPGFILGRTDPSTDPKGVLAVDALQGVALSYDLPRLATLSTSASNVFSETSLVGELQAGQIDAGFFYKVEATAAHLLSVPLVATNLAATYTAATLRAAPHPTAAAAFIAFLLSARGRAVLNANGVTAVTPLG
jgi:molybdate/tungstate transport system substrate-binding protein